MVAGAPGGATVVGARFGGAVNVIGPSGPGPSGSMTVVEAPPGAVPVVVDGVVASDSDGDGVGDGVVVVVVVVVVLVVEVSLGATLVRGTHV